MLRNFRMHTLEKKKKKPAFLSITHISTIHANYTEALLL